MKNQLACAAVFSLLVLPSAGQAQYRSIDGSGNNRTETEWGMADTQLLRRMGIAYSDDIYQMAGVNLYSPRMISNIVAAQTSSIPNRRRASDFVWQWGQFLDHDIDLTTEGSEIANIPIPPGDPFFQGMEYIAFVRSEYDSETGGSASDPRQQINKITAWIDASNVYGSDADRAMALRTLSGGKLKTSEGDLLAFNESGLPNAGGPSPEFFLGGDVRANEQVALTAMHTLFVREHNRLAEEISERRPWLDDEEIYQRARRIVGAQMQVITYNEFIPALLGRDALRRYRGYDRDVNAGIMNEFSTAAYRFGHSMLNEQLLRIDRRGREIEAGHLELKNAFFAPDEIIDHGIEPILRGLASQRAQMVDPFVVDAVRNFLFGPFDLASLNIQRGRDHGVPTYNDARESMGLERVTDFADVSSDPEVQARLAAAYGHVEYLELWVGCLAEDHVRGALVGPLVFKMLKEQFEKLRDGDRFWYARHFRGAQLRRIESTTLSDIIRRNTRIGEEIPDNVFRVGRRR
ncbi:MAG: peroxidase family protein [Gammaproteobacteria bacterium]